MSERLDWLVEQEHRRLAYDGPLPINRRFERSSAIWAIGARSNASSHWASQIRVGVARLRRRTAARRLTSERRLAQAVGQLAWCREDALAHR